MKSKTLKGKSTQRNQLLWNCVARVSICVGGDFMRSVHRNWKQSFKFRINLRDLKRATVGRARSEGSVPHRRDAVWWKSEKGFEINMHRNVHKLTFNYLWIASLFNDCDHHEMWAFSCGSLDVNPSLDLQMSDKIGRFGKRLIKSCQNNISPSEKGFLTNIIFISKSNIAEEHWVVNASDTGATAHNW